MSTILERLQERFPDRKGVNDARNIAEALAGNRGANAIADVYDGFGKSTVLYSDGLLIINELAEDRAANISEHGEVVKEYDPWCTRQPYVFNTPNDVLWSNEQSQVLSVKIGSHIIPTNTTLWFFNFVNCTSMDLNGMDTSKVINMTYMFYGCASLTDLDLSSFDTSKVEKTTAMFGGCTVLANLDVSGFDTSNVTGLSYMFQNCNALTSIDVSGFDTSNVVYMTGMFSGCTALTDLDVSGFDTSKVTQMSSMFKGSNNLETITASDAFVTTLLTETAGANVFSNCTSLVGGNGTTYSSSHTTAEYARIDTEETPGYFTAASA